jgi:maleylpyruvate isomerase
VSPSHEDLAAVPESTHLDDLSDPGQFLHVVRVLADETDRLLDTVKAMDEIGVHEPSLCEGWTRAHVMSHLARNADAVGRLVHWATTGEETPMYASPEARDADIVAGAGQRVADLEGDVESSADRLLDALLAMPPGGTGVTVRMRGDVPLASHDLPLVRLYEVVLHHLDLDTGYRLDRTDPALVDRILREAVRRLSGRQAPALTLRTTEGATYDVSGGGPEVSGSAADLVRWTTGRSDGAGLQGELPELPAWG